MKSMYLTKGFWIATLERALKTAAQTLAGALVADQTVATLDWAQVGAVVATATLLSVLSSVASVQLSGEPSLGGETTGF